MAFDQRAWWDLRAITDLRISREELRAFLAPIVASTGGTIEANDDPAWLVSIAKIFAPQRKGSISVLWRDFGTHPQERADLVSLCNGHAERGISFSVRDTDEDGKVITDSECYDLEHMVVGLAAQLAEHFDKRLIFYDQSDTVYSSDEMIQLARDGKQRDESWAYKLARSQELRQDQTIREGFAKLGLPYTPTPPLRGPTREERRVPKPPPIQVPPVTPEERAQAVERARQLVEEIVDGEVIADPEAGSVLVGSAAVVIVPGIGLARFEYGLLTRCIGDHERGHVIVFGDQMIDQQIDELREDKFISARSRAELYDFFLRVQSLHDRFVKPTDEMRSKVRELNTPPIERVRFWDGKAHQGVVLRLSERYAMLYISHGEYQIFDIQQDLQGTLLPERASISVDQNGKVLMFEATGQGRS
jgi:hypothetical protein